MDIRINVRSSFEDSKEINYYGFLVKIYAINSFISLHGYELDELLKFVEKFVSEQLDDFDNNFDTEYNETEIEEYYNPK